MSSITVGFNLSGTPSEDVTPVSCPLRLQERRRSSVVVSLPGLDVSPGDLFVSNGAADILNGSNYSGKILYCIIFIQSFIHFLFCIRADNKQTKQKQNQTLTFHIKNNQILS